MTARPVTPVGILAATLQRSVVRAGSEDVSAGLLAELRHARDIAAGLEPYVEAMTTPASEPLRALAARTATHDWGGGLEQEMLSGHVEGQALAFLVRLVGARRVLDVGMFTGYSSLAMAEALPADGTVVACERDPDAAELAREAFAASEAGDLIDVRVGPALETLGELDGPFDLVFVDADKAGYRDYVEAVLDRGLLADGGVICVDNTLMQGLPWGAGEATANGDAIADFNAWLAADARTEQVLLPLRDGLTLVRRADPARR